MSYPHKEKRYYTYDSSIISTSPDWQYSAVAFQKLLNDHFLRHTIHGIYIDAEEFLDHGVYRNHIDMTFGNGLAIVVFDNDVLVLFIHAEGMFKYKIVSHEMLKLNEHSGKLCVTGEGNTLFDITDCLVVNDYVGTPVISITVKGTNTHSFSLESFDKEKARAAEKINDLPERVIIRTQNDTEIALVGDGLEYFYIDVSSKSQIALNNELNTEITKPTIDFDKVRSLLDKGADPLGQYDPESYEEVPYIECLCNCQGLPTEDFQATEQLPDLTALFLDYGMDFATCEWDVLHPLTWLRHEYGIKTLNILLERGMSISDADCFVEELIGDMLQFEDFDETYARDDGIAVCNRYSYALKMAMLTAAHHAKHLDQCKSISVLIEPKNNDISQLPSFRNWNDFCYKTENTPGSELCGRRVSIFNQEKKCVWSFVLKGFMF